MRHEKLIRLGIVPEKRKRPNLIQRMLNKDVINERTYVATTYDENGQLVRSISKGEGDKVIQSSNKVTGEIEVHETTRDFKNVYNGKKKGEKLDVDFPSASIPLENTVDTSTTTSEDLVA